MENELTDNEKVVALYKFIKEFWASRQKSVLNDDEYEWKYFIKNIPDDPDNIKIYYQDSVINEDEENVEYSNNYLLQVHKPEFEKCPEFDEGLKDWIKENWNDYHKNVERNDYILFENEDNEEIQINFEDDNVRVQSYDVWIQKRNQWANNQLRIEKTRNFFTNLYSIYVELQRDSEIKELILSNGYIKDNQNSKINHGVLTKRISITFDANENTINVININSQTELYTDLFHGMEDINFELLADIETELVKNDYHPLDRNDTKEYLKRFIRNLSSDSKFIETIEDLENDNSRFQMFFNPSIILRKRIDGTGKALDQIIKNIIETGFVPEHLKDIVSGGVAEVVEETTETIEETLAKSGGESVEILLSKEANSEQLEIAKKIEKYNAVIVQGPPGTGKTHTISNLIGHFLAQGKSILVTSHTPKALAVLKDKIPQKLQDLCVSLIDETNADMEKSIAGITEYMAKTNSFDLEKQMRNFKAQREEIINKLAQTRKEIFNTLNKEYKSIVFNGEEINPIDAAKFVYENKEKLGYINGKNLELYSQIPLSRDELLFLYNSNQSLTSEEINELNSDLPSPDDLIEPNEFTEICDELTIINEKIKNIELETKWKIECNYSNNSTIITTSDYNYEVPLLSEEKIQDLENYIEKNSKIEEWMKKICIDGKRKGVYLDRWNQLIEEIEKLNDLTEINIANKFKNDIQINNINLADYKQSIISIKEMFQKGKKKINKIDILLHKDKKDIIDNIKINNNNLSTVEDCEILLNIIELEQKRKEVSKMWNTLMAGNSILEFNQLDESEPEKIAKNWIPSIRYCLTWYDVEYFNLIELLKQFNLFSLNIFNFEVNDNDEIQFNKIINVIKEVLPVYCNIYKNTNNRLTILNEIDNNIDILLEKKDKSDICTNLVEALMFFDAENYSNEYSNLKNIFDKTYTNVRRKELLDKLKCIAPTWAYEIENKIGIHGNSELPENIDEAWKWIQYKKILDEITKKSLVELQEESQELSKRYKSITQQYAEKCAWYNLLRKTEADITMKQALKGWELTIKKIGKAKGKNAPKYKAEARELMVKCQNAVPCWIMPFSKAIESLKPGENIFDVIIIDEASQSDIAALSIAYLAKKMIVVGDDKQVSPMAIGLETDKINALEDVYIKGKINNSHLFTSKTSLYDIASTTFQPLMLKEHFRCVPDIIGFCNMLSYDYKIKPLRDSSSSNLLPSVINYRVDGVRNGKINEIEAYNIISLMSACIEDPNYKDKSFGVISLLGEEQAKFIETLIFKYFDPRIIESRSIISGIASKFQGDERDVIFLSMVDSRSDNGPLSFQGNGVEDSTKKRYNVAVSRAKDQIWVVNSLDSSMDLKPGDIRKKLLDYTQEPKAFENQIDEINKKSESPFENEVAKKLVSEGYHIIQQYPVGAYRLDIVAICEDRKVVIECDGERFHSGEEKIREDMQRQSILERIGWRFIRIRGSQFFSNPEETMKSVINQLNMLGIFPEDSLSLEKNANTSELLDKIKAKASEKLHKLLENINISANQEENILFALDNNNILKNELYEKNSSKEKLMSNKNKEEYQKNNNEKTVVNTVVKEEKENLTFDEIKSQFNAEYNGISRKKDPINEIPEIKELIDILDNEQDYVKRKELMEIIADKKKNIINERNQNNIQKNDVLKKDNNIGSNRKVFALNDSFKKYVNEFVKDEKTIELLNKIIKDYSINDINDLYYWDYKYIFKYNITPDIIKNISELLIYLNYGFVNDFIEPTMSFEELKSKSAYFYKILKDNGATEDNIENYNLLLLMDTHNKLFYIKEYIEKYFKLGYSLF